MAANSFFTQQDIAATTIQKHVRGFLDRRHYGIKPLSREHLTNYQTLIVGNDPEISFDTLKKYRASEKLALIATSGARSISIACALSDSTHTPKIILIENSQLVYSFWYNLRKWMNDDLKSGTKELFFDNLLEFMFHNNRNIRRSHFSENLIQKGIALPASPYGLGNIKQSAFDFFEQMIAVYGYDRVRSIIKHTTLIKQGWEDTRTFKTIKNILESQGISRIVTYPSNIVAYTDYMDQKLSILQNIALLNPILSIHTDLIKSIPRNVIFTQDQTPKHVLSKIHPSPRGEEKECSLKRKDLLMTMGSMGLFQMLAASSQDLGDAVADVVADALKMQFF